MAFLIRWPTAITHAAAPPGWLEAVTEKLQQLSFKTDKAVTKQQLLADQARSTKDALAKFRTRLDGACVSMCAVEGASGEGRPSPALN